MESGWFGEDCTPHDDAAAEIARLTAEVERLNGLVCISYASAKVAVDAMERVYNEALAVGYKAEDICDAVQEFEAAASIINPPTQAQGE